MKLYNVFDATVAGSALPLVYRDWTATDQAYSGMVLVVLLVALAVGLYRMGKNSASAHLWQAGAMLPVVAAMVTAGFIFPPIFEPLERKQRGTATAELLPLTLGCKGLEQIAFSRYHCVEGRGETLQLTESQVHEKLTALLPTVDALDDASCYWIAGSLERTVTCTANSTVAQNLQGKTLFEVLKPHLDDSVKGCVSVIPEGTAGEARVYVGLERMIYLHRIATGYDCPDNGGVRISPAEMSRRLAAKASA